MSASLSTSANVPGLTAWLYRQADDREPDLSAITAQADIDTDMGHLDGCWCGCAVEPAQRPMPAEACTELGADTARPRMGLLRRMRVALLEHKLDIVRDERDRYSHAGVIGPIYHRNSLLLQIDLMKRIRELKEFA